MNKMGILGIAIAGAFVIGFSLQPAYGPLIPPKLDDRNFGGVIGHLQKQITDLREDVLLLKEFTGSEEISQLFDFDLELMSENIEKNTQDISEINQKLIPLDQRCTLPDVMMGIDSAGEIICEPLPNDVEPLCSELDEVWCEEREDCRWYSGDSGFCALAVEPPCGELDELWCNEFPDACVWNDGEAVCVNDELLCGDGVCTVDEDQLNCPLDCGFN